MTLLMLGGTGEAREIAQALAAEGRQAIVAMAGVTRGAPALPLPVRVGGFGGEAGFRAYLAEAGISAILDATHPFAAAITARTARVAAELGLAHAILNRPAWQPEPEDRWTMIATEAEAATHVRPGSTVFLATGRQTLDRFAGLEGCRVICRMIDPPTAPFPFEGGEFLIGRPPFSVESEERIMAALGVDWLVVKNAGGEAGRTKLTAARNLGIPVLMIARPPLPAARVLASVPEALAWVRALRA